MISTLITKTKNTFTFQYNETYWESFSDFIPINNASYGNIKLGRSLQMEFKFIYHSPASTYTDSVYYHENAFRVGFNNKNNRGDGAGSRYPSMWIYYIDDIPQCKFSISNENNNWKQFPNLYALNNYEIYSVNIYFNQSYIFISITNNTNTYIITNGARSGSTAQEYLDEYMHIWISQFGHNDISTPPANITMFDIKITTWDHTVIVPTINPTLNPTLTPVFVPTSNPTETPTVNPSIATTVSPSIYFPTKAPVVITSIISSEPIEIYLFYNETVAKYKENIDIYAEFVYDSIVVALENVTEHSMNINDVDMYSDATWVFGGIYDFVQCMMFNDKIIGINIECPFIPQPHNDRFEYVAVGLIYVESDGNSTDFREYIVDHLSSPVFLERFRESLSEIVVEDQSSISVLDTKENDLSLGENGRYSIGIVEILVCVVVVCGFILCVVLRVYHERKENKRKGKMIADDIQQISSSDDDDDLDLDELSATTMLHFPIERT